ncbi:M3 family oligoendopeptidase [Actomonas aquatica]|uniref:M3 family oligoendopeptidase n=1 Tax=Actomonas aquatica TaxID=2866162 RepID=A0ABZ1C876_9BACT|nr:M3 family oligoendopeptidase [Opitutus sp. WL0086]WRQ87711.1 M3 family oligoendopeptidase [Opitutus sp. WL0086]
MAAPATTWTLESYFPTFDGPEHRAFLQTLAADLASGLQTTAATAPLDATNADTWVQRFLAWEDVTARLHHLSSYLDCLGSADAANEAYQSAEAALAQLQAGLSKLTTALECGLRDASAEVWDAFIADERLTDAAHTAGRLRASAQQRMSTESEALAADLGVDGISAWGRLYGTLTGKMSFPLTWPDGRTETVPMSQRRSLLNHPDRRVRAAAFTSSNRVWEANEDTLGAALNAIAGTRHTLYARRGQPHFLDAPLHDAALSRASLEAMMEAIQNQTEVGRRILRLNARLQGTPTLAWYDLSAPQLKDTLPALDWPRATALVESAFGAAYPDLQAYFRHMLEHRWIESEKRPNKRAGAFATGSALTREERIYMTYGGTMEDVTTLAHETGHTWHSHLLNSLRPCAQDYPMTLAETASTFAEKLLFDGLLADPNLDAAQRAFLTAQVVSHAPSYLLDIPVRFKFESAFYAERQSGLVPVSRIKELMVEAQREMFGDVLEVGGEDPWFWASKLHFYITDLSFYNFPYTFGFLLSSALYQEFKHEGAAFLPRYEKFLSLTGRATCEEVVRQSLGRDLTDPAFWAEAINAINPQVDAYAAAVDALS